nr:MAG TPA: hypothetical protein [Caudoviricetes sp.]
MRILIACEESQRVCCAFRAKDMRLIAAILSIVPADILNGTSNKM